MYIRMDSNKNLAISVNTTIYRGETNADLITFLLPAKYGEITLADCAIMLRYISPSGVGRSEPLRYLPEMYKDNLQFATVANTRLTAEDGNLTVWLTALDFNDNIVLKTGEVAIHIEPSKNIADYMPQEDLDQLDQMAAQIAYLDQVKADDLDYQKDSGTLQLKSNGVLIGSEVVFGAGGPGSSGGGDIDGPGGSGSTEEDPDDVIYF